MNDFRNTRFGLLVTGALFALLTTPVPAAEGGPGAGAMEGGKGVEIERVHANYLGWRLFQQKCAECHGPDATGSAKGPDLLPRVARMDERRFVGTVLDRYAFLLPAREARGESAMREALVEQVLQETRGDMEMPAWRDEPHVRAHVRDLYAYLRARSDGRLPAGRPEP